MTRPEGWEDRLAAEIAAAAKRPWAWGSHDCATFAWRCARAVADAPTRWDGWFAGHASEAEAEALIARHGGLMAMMGEDGRVAPKLARRGDVALLRHEGRAVLGAVDLPGVRVAAAPAGLTLLPRAAVLAAWSV